jgi:hypothetical protein
LQICRQLHPDPDLGLLKHDHELTLIFFSLHEGVLPNPWIKRGDPTMIWPRDWLPGEEQGLGNNILLLSVECYVQRKTEFSVPLQKILDSLCIRIQTKYSIIDLLDQVIKSIRLFIA